MIPERYHVDRNNRIYIVAEVVLEFLIPPKLHIGGADAMPCPAPGRELFTGETYDRRTVTLVRVD